MNRKIARNIAIVSAFFIVTFSIMLITNYFQVRGFNPLQTEVIETLKQINDENSGNTELQEQIRQLDLLARRAYFVRIDHLKTGIYLLVGMLVVFIVTARCYFAGIKNVPEKDIDPIDEWAEKTRARKYVNGAAGGLVAVALLFAFLSSPYLNHLKNKESKDEKTETAEGKTDESLPSGEEESFTSDTAELLANTTENPGGNVSAPITDSLPANEPEMPKVTHNSFRGNNSSAITAAKNIPTSWNLSTDENIAWKSDIARHGYN